MQNIVHQHIKLARDKDVKSKAIDTGRTVEGMGFSTSTNCLLSFDLCYFLVGARNAARDTSSHMAIYHYIRHLQYTGFLLVSLGMIFEWATLPLLFMWPILAVLYYRLAKKEEAEMQKEFGQQYFIYRSKTGMFLPRLWHASQVKQASSS